MWISFHLMSVINSDLITKFCLYSKGSRKKSSFFSGQSTKAFSPAPLGLVVKRRLQKKHLKKFFFLSGQPLPPSPLLLDCPLKNYLFLQLSLQGTQECILMIKVDYIIYKHTLHNNMYYTVSDGIIVLRG